MTLKKMMNEQIPARVWAIILCIVALLSLGSEMFVAYLEHAAGCASYFARGFNLPEFSPLGFIPMLTPIVLILLLFADLPYASAIKSLFVVAIINAVSFNHALISLHSEMIGPVKWIVHLQWGIPVYMLAIMLAETAVFISLRTKIKSANVHS